MLVLHVLLGFALLHAVSPGFSAAVDRTIIVVELVKPSPPPSQPTRPARRTERKSGKAAPPNLKQEPTPVVAPPPVLPVMIPTIVTAPIAGSGAAPDAGAARVPGPGTGAAGQGDGRGAGEGGDGDGAGDEGYVPPRQIRGRLRNSDYPQDLGVAGVGGRVSVRYLVETDGRVTECEITRSSGNAELDATTCRLITERFVFRPSRDGRGRPVASYVVENHSWVVE